ncbi:hypothetical protein HBI46_116940 [Parastagonospora nodorum]|nr:hypothetical protein HBI10_236710 [Parastagonospora nodorum]KAH5417906.1 hypothetical protein HBI46_116940 [Parastagonospora nodorum]KAH6453600.1 hypothetical protein HBI57_152710 [Parastagonospora nodorum]
MVSKHSKTLRQQALILAEKFKEDQAQKAKESASTTAHDASVMATGTDIKINPATGRKTHLDSTALTPRAAHLVDKDASLVTEKTSLKKSLAHNKKCRHPPIAPAPNVARRAAANAVRATALANLTPLPIVGRGQEASYPPAQRVPAASVPTFTGQAGSSAYPTPDNYGNPLTPIAFRQETVEDKAKNEPMKAPFFSAFTESDGSFFTFGSPMQTTTKVDATLDWTFPASMNKPLSHEMSNKSSIFSSHSTPSIFDVLGKRTEVEVTEIRSEHATSTEPTKEHCASLHYEELGESSDTSGSVPASPEYETQLSKASEQQPSACASAFIETDAYREVIEEPDFEFTAQEYDSANNEVHPQNLARTLHESASPIAIHKNAQNIVEPWNSERMFFADADGFTRLVDMRQTLYDVAINNDDVDSDFDSIASPYKPIATPSPSGSIAASTGFESPLRTVQDAGMTSSNESEDEADIERMFFAATNGHTRIVEPTQPMYDMDITLDDGDSAFDSEYSPVQSNASPHKLDSPLKMHEEANTSSSEDTDEDIDMDGLLGSFRADCTYLTQELVKAEGEVTPDTDLSFSEDEDVVDPFLDFISKEVTVLNVPEEDARSSELVEATLGTESLSTFLSHLQAADNGTTTNLAIVATFLKLVSLEREKLAMPSITNFSNAATQTTLNIKTKPTQAQQKLARKQASKNKGGFSMFADDEPKSQVVGGFYMDALMAQAQDNKAAAEAAKSSAVEASKEVKMKDAASPPAWTKPFSGVTKAPARQRIPSGNTASTSASHQVSSTLSDPSSKSSAPVAPSSSKPSKGQSARPSGPWEYTGSYKRPQEYEENQTITPAVKPPTLAKTNTAAPKPDKDGWINVVSKKSRNNAPAAPQNILAPVAATNEAPNISRGQKKKAAAALAAARAVPHVFSPALSSITSPVLPEVAPKQQESEWSTVASKNSGKKSTPPPLPSKTLTQTVADFPALSAPKIKVSPFAKPSRVAPVVQVQSPKPAAILKITNSAAASDPTKECPQIEVTPAVPEVSNFTELTGSALDTAMADWSGQVGVHMNRLAGMMVTDSFVKSKPEVLVASLAPFVDTPAPVLGSPSSAPVVVGPVPAVTVSKTKKSRAQKKQAKKAKASAKVLADEAAMNEPTAHIQQTATVEVPETITPTINDNSIAEHISPVVLNIVQRSTDIEQILEKESFIRVTNEQDLVEAVVEMIPAPSRSLADIVMSDGRFSLQFGFEDASDNAEPLQSVDMTDDRSSLQIILIPVELDDNVLRLCDIVQAEIFAQQESDDENSKSLAASPSRNPPASAQELQLSDPSSVAAKSIASAPAENRMTLVDIRVNQLHMGSICIADIIEGIAHAHTNRRHLLQEAGR